MKRQRLLYYVEGDDEVKLLNTLKSELFAIEPGKIEKFNVIQQRITKGRLISIPEDTIVVLVFDTDTGNIDILNENIRALESCQAVSKVITIPQVRNLEDELVRSCNIRYIRELLNSSSDSDFKSDIRKITNLKSKLTEHEFDINCFWNSTPCIPYDGIANMACEVKR